MGKYDIILDKSLQYNEKITEFWNLYLPGTPNQRLKWLNSCTEGKTKWFIAVEKNEMKVAGTVSLMPKNFKRNNKKVKAAIVGDLMIDKKHRVFGPAMLLLKRIISYSNENNYDFIYTIPNNDSEKLIEKVGFKQIGKCVTLFYPTKVDFIFKKYIGDMGSKIFGNIIVTFYKLSKYKITLDRKTVIENINNFENNFEEFINEIYKKRKYGLTSYLNEALLNWRYFENPNLLFKILTIKKVDNNEILGFCAYSITNKRLQLYDIAAKDKKFVHILLKNLANRSKLKQCKGIYCLIYENNPILQNLIRFGFIDIKDHAKLFAYPQKAIFNDPWYFTSAERNI